MNKEKNFTAQASARPVLRTAKRCKNGAGVYSKGVTHLTPFSEKTEPPQCTRVPRGAHVTENIFVIYEQL